MAHDHHDDDRPRHLSGPTLDQDGFLIGEIALPGGLPPDEDDDQDEQDAAARFEVPRWDQALTRADRDGFVLFDPDTPGGFRALTDAQHHDLSDSIRASAPHHAVAAADPNAAPELDHDQARPTRGSSPAWGDDDEATAVAYDRGSWTEPSTGRSPDSRGHGARELPETPARPERPEDREEIERRLDAARTRLTGHTWREGVDRDDALAERSLQLGRWYDDDAGEQGDSSDDAADGEESHGILPNCLIHPDDPRWYR